MRTRRFKGMLRRQAGFSLLEVLIVLGIVSLLSVMMVVSIDGSRRAGLTAQSESEAQQICRAVVSILERDARDAGSGIFTATYRRNNGGEVGELTGNQNPDTFDYSIDATDLEGLMVPPLEVVNGTDTQPASYLNPIDQTIGLTNTYRMPNTDIFTIYSIVNSVFQGRIDDYEGLGQENFVVTQSSARASRITSMPWAVNRCW
jgi:prepilin-type N-terminal cleavage/methylation domain-containing protein